MNYLPFFGRRSLIVLTFIFVLLAIKPATGVIKAEPGGSNEVDPEWTKSLPSRACPGSSSDTNCHRSSPVVVDLTGDGKLEIIVATNNGHVLVFRHNGSLIWSKDVAPYFGMAAGTQQIHSSPAVADLDGNGKIEIVVGAGTTSHSICTQGGVIALSSEGNVIQGFPVLSDNWEIPPKGCRETVFSTPALGDLNLDGKLEIVYGGFDKRIYAIDLNGKFLPGFPPNSYHYQRFGWDVLKGRLGDTIWSSPAIADISGNGYPDLVIGSDEGNYDSRWKPVIDPWNCPYAPVRTPGYCGGSIYAVDHNGNFLPGFPRYIHESVTSSPAVLDGDGDDRAEIFVGTGSYYYNKSPDKPSLGFRLFGMDNKGNDLPGWSGGKPVGGVVTASPAIGDITGDGKPNIVVAARDRKLYAWHLNGQPVAGFPMTPRTHFNQVLDDYDVGTGFILADYTGDGKMEIFLRHAAEIVIVSGSGHQLTATHSKDTKPAYYTGARVWNNPAVGDLDGDGHLELVVQNSKLHVWDLPNSSPSTDWPMFKRDAARTGAAVPDVSINPEKQELVIEEGFRGSKDFAITVYGRLGDYDWQISAAEPDLVKFDRSSGTVQGIATIPVTVEIPPNMPVGDFSFGIITVKVFQNGNQVMRQVIPLTIQVVEELNRSYLPFLP